MSGYPWLTKIPILKYLFGQENKDHRENEIVFAITPHIVRAEEIPDENLRLIDVGTSSIGLRYKESKPAKSKDSQSPLAQSRQRPQPKAPLISCFGSQMQCGNESSQNSIQASGPTR